MPTTRETILTALHARLPTLAATALRDEVLRERVPAAGLVILRDGEPGEPDGAQWLAPKLVGPTGFELAVHLVIRAGLRCVRVGRDDLFAPDNPF